MNLYNKNPRFSLNEHQAKVRDIIMKDIAYPKNYKAPVSFFESYMATKKLKNDLKHYEKMMDGLSGSHNQKRFDKQEAFVTLTDNYKLLQSKDSYMQYKMFGGPKSMEEYAKKKQAVIDRRERFRLKYQVINEEMKEEDDTEGDNTEYELEYPLETTQVKEPGAETVVGGPSNL